MTTKELLLKRLPKKYHSIVADFTEESDLIDNCKYLLHYSKDYTNGECYGGTIPCKSINEAIRLIKNLKELSESRKLENKESEEE